MSGHAAATPPFPPGGGACLDANATEPIRPEARAAALAAMDLPGNPSAVHAAGREARRMLEAARTTIAGRFGAAPAGVVFTSGATEANALAIHGLGAAGGRRLLVGATEHPSVLRAVGPAAVPLPVLADGRLDLAALEARLAEPGAPPALLLADEPTGNLDRATGAQVMELLFALRERHGTTLLLITHDPALAARCGRRVRIEDGRIVADEGVAAAGAVPPQDRVVPA